MDVKEIKQAKAECEAEINKIINRFQHKTGMSIYGIDIDFIDISTIGAETRESIVTIEIRIK